MKCCGTGEAENFRENKTRKTLNKLHPLKNCKRLIK